MNQQEFLASKIGCFAGYIGILKKNMMVANERMELRDWSFTMGKGGRKETHDSEKYFLQAMSSKTTYFCRQLGCTKRTNFGGTALNSMIFMHFTSIHRKKLDLFSGATPLTLKQFQGQLP